jgi:hypothetical protein
MTTSRNVPPATSVSADDHATKARELAESVVNKVQAFTDSIGEIPNRNACEQGLAKLLEPALRAAAEAEREACAQLIERQAQHYTTDVFPEDGTSTDCISASMGRHCAKIWPEIIRARGGAR